MKLPGVDGEADVNLWGGNLSAINDADGQSWLISAFGGAALSWIG